MDNFKGLLYIREYIKYWLLGLKIWDEVGGCNCSRVAKAHWKNGAVGFLRKYTSGMYRKLFNGLTMKKVVWL